jgi:starch phosphorylase
VSPDCVGSYETVGEDVITLEKESEADGKTVFSTRMQPPYPGLQTIRLRVYPYHTALTHRFEMGAMLWA